MNNEKIFLGNTQLNPTTSGVKGGFVQIEGEKFYKISNYNEMPDFFMTIVSIADHWIFISSNGSLTAGRKDRDSALFPYYSVDKIHDSLDIAGSKTLALVSKNGKKYLWEPFSKKIEGIYSIERNIYKSIYGNKLIFEEINNDLCVAFQYGWYFSNKYGFIKKSVVSNKNNKAISIELLDGIKNILPNGADYNFQNEYSNLLDAYKKNELVSGTNLGLFSLSSIPVDRAEPSESLNATTVWSAGLDRPKILISEKQIDNFCKGLPIQGENDIRATRGAYFVNADLNIGPNKNREWVIVAEVNQDSTDVANLNRFLSSNNNFIQIIGDDIGLDTTNLKKLVANADGLQAGNEELTLARHYANTLYNIMRGGVFIANYKIDKLDFIDFVKQTNKNAFQKSQNWLNAIPNPVSSTELLNMAEHSVIADIERICYEYLPLTFSRRHGDPSRPWNQFSIDITNTDGSVKSDYQGNWRDIFQNWEALALSFPEFTEQMICKFVNASTPDGYNPYRITKNGVDWERPNPNDPWAFIGYWGDHQIIYLQKLLEISNNYHPGELHKLLSKQIFVYANVPYRIKPYSQIVEKPQDTIVFDNDLDKSIDKLTEQIGTDGKLLHNGNNTIHNTNLTEKMLVSVLAKLSNFIPEAGIWLNTQRPEWNDANNALVGNGVSMVTLYYLRRSLKFWINIFNGANVKNYSISEEVKILFDDIFNCFAENSPLLKNGFTDADKRKVTNVLGEAGSRYRVKIYEHSFSGNKKNISANKLVEFAEIALKYIDKSIEANRRPDGLYHAYNLVTFTKNEIKTRFLYEMLEGQVAVLSSGYLSATESLNVLDALKGSKLFRKDQYSYLLYPNKNLPLFVEKNIVSTEDVNKSVLLSTLVKNRDKTIILQDVNGNYHFNGTFRNSEVLMDALSNLDKEKYHGIVEKERDLIGSIYEKMFDHKSFTGRSGTFYGFEGLGSIYWHMVSKLLLAVQESYFNGLKANTDPVVLGRIKDHYYEIKAGIGLNKSPELYGAFPIDAYSHTPGHAGAQQPGMTGQVKEDIITRFGELGVIVENGQIALKASLLSHHEILTKNTGFEYLSLNGETSKITLQKGQLAFTYCGVPFVYHESGKQKIEVKLLTGQVVNIDGNTIDKKLSKKIFERSGEITQVDVFITI